MYSIHRSSQYRVKDGETPENIEDLELEDFPLDNGEWSDNQKQNLLTGNTVDFNQDPFYYNIENAEIHKLEEALIQAKTIYNNSLIKKGKLKSDITYPEPLEYINRYGLDTEYHIPYGMNAKEIILTLSLIHI